MRWRLRSRTCCRSQARSTYCPTCPVPCTRPLPGDRGSATTSVRCLDVAALVAAAILRKNPDAEVLPFNDKLVPIALNPRDTVMTNAAKLAALPQGGTNCSAPLAYTECAWREGRYGDLRFRQSVLGRRCQRAGARDRNDGGVESIQVAKLAGAARVHRCSAIQDDANGGASRHSKCGWLLGPGVRDHSGVRSGEARRGTLGVGDDSIEI